MSPDDHKWGCWADGQVCGEPVETKEEAEVIAEDVRGDFPNAVIEIDTIRPEEEDPSTGNHSYFRWNTETEEYEWVWVP